MTERETVRLEIRGRQTDPDGNTQENTAVYRAVHIPEEKGHLFRYRDGEETAELYVSRSLVRMERAGSSHADFSGKSSSGRSSSGFSSETSSETLSSGNTSSDGQDSGTRMVFDPSVPFTRCAYHTPYGTIPMEIRTDRIAVLDSGSDRSGSGQVLRARVRYTLRMDETYSLQCSVTIRADREP